MFFYRHPRWGIGFKILMIVLLIAGGTFVARSAFQAGFLQGAAVEGSEITAPVFYPHAKGFAPYPFARGGSFFSILALFFGGILLIKVITSIVGLVLFNKWKAEGGPDWEDWMANRYYPHPHHCGPYYRKWWGPHAYPPHTKDPVEESSQEQAGEKTES